jgi:hypothetical protein
MGLLLRIVRNDSSAGDEVTNPLIEVSGALIEHIVGKRFELAPLLLLQKVLQ